MKNIISFPEARMKRTKKMQNSGARNAAISLSLVSLLMGALLLNDSLLRSQRPQYLLSDNLSSSDIQNLNRAIASAQPMNPFRDIEWEKKIALRLEQDYLEDRTPASIGRSASTLDQLRFGPLAGKYHLVNRPGIKPAKVQEISYIDSNVASDRPVFVDPEKFLKEYGGLLAVDFSLFDKANPNQTLVREYRLLNEMKKVVGTAAFVMDEEGRMLSLKVSREQQ